MKAEKRGVARVQGVGEKEKESTTECKSQRRLDEMDPWALNDRNGEGGGDEKKKEGEEEEAGGGCLYS